MSTGPKTRCTPSTYPVKLTVFCDDRFGMLKQITAVIGDAKSNIRNIEARTDNGQARRRYHPRYQRPQASGNHHPRRAQDSRRARCAETAENLVASRQSSARSKASLADARWQSSLVVGSIPST